MSAVQQLEQELQNELVTSNQLLYSISYELKQIKQFTKPGGKFEENIKMNTNISETLASILQLDIENLPPMNRMQTEQNDTSQQGLLQPE